MFMLTLYFNIKTSMKPVLLISSNLTILKVSLFHELKLFEIKNSVILRKLLVITELLLGNFTCFESRKS